MLIVTFANWHVFEVPGSKDCFGAAFGLSPGTLNRSLCGALIDLPFNPVKMVLLIGWVYLCMYTVQRIQFSRLVPKKYKSLASVFGLLAGPVILFGLAIIDTYKRIASGEGDALQIIKGSLRNIIVNVKSLTFVGADKELRMRLLDPSGKELKEVYGASKGLLRTNPVIDLTEQIIGNALQDRASDVLIDPTDDSNYTIRYRVDGVLRIAYDVKSEVCKAVINSIKAISQMDIAEKRRPQDGSFLARTGEDTSSFRVASAGVRYGEKLSIRVLNQDVDKFTLDSIGLTEKQKTVIKEIITKPSGMILLSGPTGSGKTTTMYAMLNELDLFTRNVITVEDPIEYVLPNASQIEVNAKAGITFAKSLRSILRQDPDVICVGEIRDNETATIALSAAQTGHLVLATVHCQSNAAAIVRLMDLGVSPVMMASGLNVIICQRLLRQLCGSCKVPAELSPGQINDFRRKNINYQNICQARGCSECGETGYRDRIAVCDVLVLNETVKAAIANSNTFLPELRSQGNKKGQSNLYKQALKQVVSGITSLEELKRVIG